MPRTAHEPRTLRTAATNPDAEAYVGPRPACPRCAYDLTGHTGGWAEVCPLDGRCSECGLDFRWGTVLNPALQSLPWLYEHSPRWWAARAWLETTIRAAFPWHFWRRVELHHRVSPSRLWQWWAGAWILLLLGAAVSAAATALVAALPTTPPARYSPVYAMKGIDIIKVSSAGPGEYRIVDGENTVSVALPSEYLEAARHGSSIVLGNDPVLMEVDSRKLIVFFDRTRGQWFRDDRPPTFVERDTVDFMSIDPRGQLSSRRPGRWRSPAGELMPEDTLTLYLVTVPAPIAIPLSDSLFGPFGAVIGGGVRQAFGGAGVIPFTWAVEDDPPSVLQLLWGCAYSAVAALIVLAAPSEWRRARVRTAHLARIAVYALTPLVGAMLLRAAALLWTYIGYNIWVLAGAPATSVGWSRSPGGWFVPPGWMAIFARSEWLELTAIVILIWSPIWWWFALSRGMRLRRVWPLWTFVTIGGWLAAINATLLAREF